MGADAILGLSLLIVGGLAFWETIHLEGIQDVGTFEETRGNGCCERALSDHHRASSRQVGHCAARLRCAERNQDCQGGVTEWKRNGFFSACGRRFR